MSESISEPPLPPEFWERLENGETVPFRGLGKSMLPFYPSGTWFLLQAAPLNSLKVGDLIYTGTPEGVGKVLTGDILKGFITDKEMLKVVVK